MKFGFVNISACAPRVRVADTAFNVGEIENEVVQAEGRGVEIIVFPEMCITGYTCGDLFLQQTLIEEAEMAMISLMQFTRSLNIIIIVGLPVAWRGTLLNCAAVLQKGRILGLVPKTYLPNYKEFYEMRWFHSGAGIDDMVWLCGSQVPVSSSMIFNSPSCRFGIEICEDLWSPIPPSSLLYLQGADIVFNLSADNDAAGKRAYLESMLAATSSRCMGGYVYAGCGYGESTQDLVFCGKTIVYEAGKLLANSPEDSIEPIRVDAQIDVERMRNARRQNTTFASTADMFVPKTAPSEANTQSSFVGATLFSRPNTRNIDCELFTPREAVFTRKFSATPFVPHDVAKRDKRCFEVFNIQVMGLCRRLQHTSAKTAVIGVSGGLDSTLALLVAAKAMDRLGRDRKDIVAVTMPGFGTSNRTYYNALELMNTLGCTVREISIVKSVIQHFSDLDIDPDVHDTTYENAQARERTQILMDAANQTGGLVVGTGDLSELALGWATYNGDHMSMYGVNASLPKTLIPWVIRWALDHEFDGMAALRTLLEDIIDTPISPELIPTDDSKEIVQKTEDLVGPYELHDFFLYHTLRHGFRPAKIAWMAEQSFDGRYSHEEIKHWITTFFRRFFAQQFKRSCLPDGPKAMSVSLSPRGDWRMPSDACSTIWMAECEKL
ncbi:MAG: NAD(+) synthase [Bacteroidaceae bacterium]|nr:NAD(+) synthase [Bacteroidaceae bacterium]